MSALPGGSAAKLALRYEDWWTLLRVADVLAGKAARIRLEPPAAEGRGIEFWIDEPGIRWCEQAKDAPARGSWTINRLMSEGVLGCVQGHLAEGNSVRLVLSTVATDLSALTERAAKSGTPAEFHGTATNSQAGELPGIAAAWGTDPETTWRYLQRVRVEHHPPDALRRLVHLKYELLIQGAPEDAVHNLRGWLTGQLQEYLTAPLIWTHLSDAGFPRRLMAGDTSTLAALTTTVERQQRRAELTLPTMGVIEQPYTAQVVQRVSGQEQQVVILDGRAGSGKSTVATEAVSELARQGWYAAVLRMSAVNPGTRTARALGRDSDLDESPAILLDGVADGSPAVLLVDQLDAVSDYSGRLPDSFDAVTELLEQARLMPTLKVVLAVRTVDLHEDPRMRHLLADTARVTMVTIGDLDPDAVRKALQAAAVDTATMPEATLRLLCVPLHFAVFSRLSPEAQRIPYRTLPELYDRYTSELRQQAERQAGHLDWAGITAALVGYMNEHESLLAPEEVLDNAARQEISTLVSAGVLVRDGHRLGFFHETYFDYLFARTFVTQGRDLHDFLAGSGQHLFRRAQARQVLEYLAATDRDAFRRAAVGLLTSDRIRPHLRDVVARVLSELDAGPGDLRALEPFMFDGAAGQARLLPLLSSPAWFDAADQAGRWDAWLAAEATVDDAGHQLIVAARSRPERVTELVQPYIGTPGAWRQRLRALFQWSLSPALVGLSVRLLERGDLDDVRGPIAVNSDFFTILYQLAQDDPAGTARIIGAYLRRQQARAAADGSNDPAESGHLPDHSGSGPRIITRVARQAPRVFLDEVLPFLVPVIDATAMPGRGGRLRATGRWGMRYVGDPTGIAEAVFAGTEEAFRSLAAEAPEEALALARPLAGTDVEDLRFLACRAFTAAGSGDEAVSWLLSDDRNLNLGWADSPRAASRELIASATRHCSAGQLGALTRRLLGFYPPRELTAQRRHLRGRAQYELISAVEPSRRDTDVTRRLGELERKFTGSEPATPQPVVACRVGPPVPDRASHVMTDEDWLRAIARHSSEKTTWTGDTAVGGACELAELLAQRAAEEPERYARLALRLDAQTPPAHITRVIEEVAGQIPISLLGELCQHAQDIAGAEAGRSICFAVSRVAGDADDVLVTLLRQCAADPDPDREIARVSASPGKLFVRGDLLQAGLNSTRGSAARAIADVLFAGPEHVDALVEPLAALVADPILAVRSWAAEAVRALMNHRPQLALDLAETLLTGSGIQLFGTPTVMGLLISAFTSRPGQFAPHLQRALVGPDPVAEQGGQAWAVALLRDMLSPPLPAELTSLSAAARRGAAKLLASYPVEGLPPLSLLFADADPGVRAAAAASALHALPSLEPRDADPLLRAFTSSPAFAEHPDIAAAALAASTQILPDATLMACERAVTAAGRSLGDLRTRHPVTADQILSVLLRLYRQGDSAIRQRCLDVIDQLSEFGAFELNEKLDDIR